MKFKVQYRENSTSRRSQRGLVLTFLLSIVVAFSLSAQVSSTIDTTTIRIGEEIKYTIAVEADTTALVLFPEGQSFAPLETIDSYKTDTTRLGGQYRLIKKYGITQFDSGRYKLPAQRVMIDDRVFITDSAFVEVRDVPVDTTKQKMFDIKPAIEVESPPFDFLRLLYWILPLLLIGLIVFLLFRRKKRKKAREKQLPPYDEAMVALQELDGANLLLQNNSKAYYSSLTEIVKRYIDREVDATALESTSDELIERLQLHKDAGHFDFDTTTLKKLDAIFKRADLVKFAKMQQESGQARADRASIEDIINETKEVLPEPTEDELMEDEVYKELQAKKEKRLKIKKAVGVAVLVGVVTIAVNIATQGWEAVRDSLFGNEMKELAEGRWYSSEYGIPAIVMDTPEVLTRRDLPVPENVKEAVNVVDYFEYGSVENGFFVGAQTITFKPELAKEGISEDALDVFAEDALNNLENLGAINMIAKKESFSTEAGIDGLKAYGDFNFKNEKGKILKNKVAYEILLFKQNNGIQMVQVYFENEDFNAVSMKDRVINSVELEIDPAQQKQKKEEN